MLGWLHSKPAEEVLPAPLRPAVMMGGHAGRGSSWWYSPSHTRPAFNSPGSHSALWWAWWYRQEGWKVNKTVYWVCCILRFRKMGRPLVQTHKICMECRRSGFHPWVRKIPWRRAWNTLQYSCLEDPMDRGVWRLFYNSAETEANIMLTLLVHTCKHITEASPSPCCKKKSSFYLFEIYFSIPNL